MKTKYLKGSIGIVLKVALFSLLLLGLAGCGIGHGPQRHGYSKQQFNNHSHTYRNGYGEPTDNTTAPGHNAGQGVSSSSTGHDYRNNGNCSW
jgi:hypothetical protein